MTSSDTGYLPPTSSYTSMDQVIDDIRMKLRAKMIDHNQWLTNNPTANPNDDLTFRARRQEIKLLELRLAEALQMKQQYETQSVVPPVNPVVENVYKFRNNEPVQHRGTRVVPSRSSLLTILK